MIGSTSTILKGIRDYNEDDCKSTAELLQWLRKVAVNTSIATPRYRFRISPIDATESLPPEVVARLDIAAKLRKQGDAISVVLADLIDFHRREEKPMWWRMFDRAEATPEELRDDPGCIEGARSRRDSRARKEIARASYRFDPSQECKTAAADDNVMFTHNLDAKFTLLALDASTGTVEAQDQSRRV